MKTSRILALSAIALVGATALTGCGTVEAMLYKRTTMDFDDATALATQWTGTPATWVPADSGGIRAMQSNMSGAEDASIAVLTKTALDPALCTEVDRVSAPSYTFDDLPDPYRADRVLSCGEWTVMKTPDGWFGWTPGKEKEQVKAG
ncbi:hypothetical protein [Microbacterium sp.]|uniref:hypothetical protein n=1 Tax=Microbacterium sp. TaxID=51671 RepID=UPI00333E948B